MKKIALVLVLLSVICWFMLGRSEASRVKKTFDKAAEALEKEGVESPYASMAKVRTLVALVGAECRLEVPERNYVSSVAGQDLAREIALFRTQSTRIKVAFEDLSVQIVDDATAQATCDFFYGGDAAPLGFSGRDARALEATLKKDSDSGNWRFVRVRLLPILAK